MVRLLPLLSVFLEETQALLGPPEQQGHKESKAYRVSKAR
jgi:hypothetical protein